jgi:hypothetical protein
MEGSHINLSIFEVNVSLHDDDLLKQYIVRELWKLSVSTKISFSAFLTKLDAIVAKVREDTVKFKSSSSDNPYPPPGVNQLTVQIELPKEVKVGITQWSSYVQV